MKRYHGWIYVEKEPGYRDSFSVHVTRANNDPRVARMGYGERGAAAAVAFFEEPEVKIWYPDDGSTLTVIGLNLGPVKLEKTPIGLRVFTEVDDTKVITDT